MRVELFMDPVSGWSWWAPALLVEEFRPDQERTSGWQRPADQRLGRRLLGWMGAWFGIYERTPEGVWRRVPAARRGPREPGAQGRHRSLWSWWCR